MKMVLICRYCSNKNAKVSLQSSSETENKVDLLLDNIKYCLGIEISLDNEPKTICEQCKDKFDNFAYFKKLCLDSEERLQRLQTIVKVECLEVDAKFSGGSEYEDEINANSNIYNEKIKIKHSLENTELPDVKIEPPPVSGDVNNYIDDKTTDPKLKKECLAHELLAVKPVIKKYERKKKANYCYDCYIDLKTEESFKAHNLEEHGITFDGNFNCFGCDRIFKSQASRSAHESGFCEGLNDGFKCKLCDRYLPTRRIYQTHLKNHKRNVKIVLPEKIFQCPKCPASFETRNSFKMHLKSHKVKVKKHYICDSCGADLSSRRNLIQHLDTHKDSRPFKCPHCDYSCRHGTSLTYHIRTHTGERPYSCHKCPRRFVQLAHLKNHLTTHTDPNIKNFECTICHNRFRYKGGLTQHMLACHEKARFMCYVCGRTYARKYALQVHLSTIHKEKIK